MGVSRYELSDGQWERIASLLPGKCWRSRWTGADYRLRLNKVLWLPGAGAYWRDLPDRYGKVEDGAPRVVATTVRAPRPTTGCGRRRCRRSG